MLSRYGINQVIRTYIERVKFSSYRRNYSTGKKNKTHTSRPYSVDIETLGCFEIRQLASDCCRTRAGRLTGCARAVISCYRLLITALQVVTDLSRRENVRELSDACQYKDTTKRL